MQAQPFGHRMGPHPHPTMMPALPPGPMPRPGPLPAPSQFANFAGPRFASLPPPPPVLLPFQGGMMPQQQGFAPQQHFLQQHQQQQPQRFAPPPPPAPAPIYTASGRYLPAPGPSYAPLSHASAMHGAPAPPFPYEAIPHHLIPSATPSSPAPAPPPLPLPPPSAMNASYHAIPSRNAPSNGPAAMRAGAAPFKPPAPSQTVDAEKENAEFAFNGFSGYLQQQQQDSGAAHLPQSSSSSGAPHKWQYSQQHPQQHQQAQVPLPGMGPGPRWAPARDGPLPAMGPGPAVPPPPPGHLLSHSSHPHQLPSHRAQSFAARGASGESRFGAGPEVFAHSDDVVAGYSGSAPGSAGAAVAGAGAGNLASAYPSSMHSSGSTMGPSTSTMTSSSAAATRLLESPNSKAQLQTWARKFTSIAKTSPSAAYAYGLRFLSIAPASLKWRVCVEIADLARRHNRWTQARLLYQTALHLQPAASQAYLEYAKLEEEAGELASSARIMDHALDMCKPDETLFIKALRQHERLGDVAAARGVLARAGSLRLDKSWRVLVEGALMEAREGSEQTARRVFRYLIQNVNWYGPIYAEASAFEENRENFDRAEAFAERGVTACPRYGPLWLSLIRLKARRAFHELAGLAKEASPSVAATMDACLVQLQAVACSVVDTAAVQGALTAAVASLPRARCAQVLAPVREIIGRTEQVISQELLWKVHIERAGIEAQLLDFAAARDAHADAIDTCPASLRWKVWISGARLEMSAALHKFRTLETVFAAATESPLEGVGASKSVSSTKSGAGSPLGGDSSSGMSSTATATAAVARKRKGSTSFVFTSTLSTDAPVFTPRGLLAAGAVAGGAITPERSDTPSPAPAVTACAPFPPRATLASAVGILREMTACFAAAAKVLDRAMEVGPVKMRAVTQIECAKLCELEGVALHLGQLLLAKIAGAPVEQTHSVETTRVPPLGLAAVRAAIARESPTLISSPTLSASPSASRSSYPSSSSISTTSEAVGLADALFVADPLATGRSRARRVLEAAKQDASSDWKVAVEAVCLEIRCGQRDRAITEAEAALAAHPGTGRLWAMLIALKLEDGLDAQLATFQRAIAETPKSGEVWCEAAKILLNPTSPCFNLKAAARFLRFALYFTPQYGDSFVELLRVKMLLHGPEHAAIERLQQYCINTNPNYGIHWNACRVRGPTTSVREVFRTAANRVLLEIQHYASLYQTAILRSFLTTPESDSVSPAALSAATSSSTSMFQSALSTPTARAAETAIMGAKGKEGAAAAALADDDVVCFGGESGDGVVAPSRAPCDNDAGGNDDVDSQGGRLDDSFDCVDLAAHANCLAAAATDSSVSGDVEGVPTSTAGDVAGGHVACTPRTRSGRTFSRVMLFTPSTPKTPSASAAASAMCARESACENEGEAEGVGSVLGATTHSAVTALVFTPRTPGSGAHSGSGGGRRRRQSRQSGVVALPAFTTIGEDVDEDEGCEPSRPAGLGLGLGEEACVSLRGTCGGGGHKAVEDAAELIGRRKRALSDDSMRHASRGDMDIQEDSHEDSDEDEAGEEVFALRALRQAAERADKEAAAAAALPPLPPPSFSSSSRGSSGIGKRRPLQTLAVDGTSPHAKVRAVGSAPNAAAAAHTASGLTATPAGKSKHSGNGITEGAGESEGEEGNQSVDGTLELLRSPAQAWDAPSHSATGYAATALAEDDLALAKLGVDLAAVRLDPTSTASSSAAFASATSEDEANVFLAGVFDAAQAMSAATVISKTSDMLTAESAVSASSTSEGDAGQDLAVSEWQAWHLCSLRRLALDTLVDVRSAVKHEREIKLTQTSDRSDEDAAGTMADGEPSNGSSAVGELIGGLRFDLKLRVDISAADDVVSSRSAGTIREVAEDAGRYARSCEALLQGLLSIDSTVW